MSRIDDDIQALLERANRDIVSIEVMYNKSLQSQNISSDLKIDIKNLCGHLRSVLDYLAHDIRAKYCQNAKRANFYFPIFMEFKDFSAKVNGWYPGLDRACPDLWNYFESIQPYHPDYSWIGQFNRINNQNKHTALVEQKRIQRERIHVIGINGGGVSWNPSSVRFGDNVCINCVPVNVSTQIPYRHPSQVIERRTWVDFQFDGISISALGLMKQSLSGINKIVVDIRKWL